MAQARHVEPFLGPYVCVTDFCWFKIHLSPAVPTALYSHRDCANRFDVAFVFPINKPSSFNPLHPRQMLALDPADIVTKLTTLFIIVLFLFCSMHIVGAILYSNDVRTRKGVLRSLQQRAVGFRVEEGGCWTWDFSPPETNAPEGTPSAAAVGPADGSPASLERTASARRTPQNVDESGGDSVLVANSGPLAAFSRIVGCPAIRLRLAIPETMIPGDICALLHTEMPSARLQPDRRQRRCPNNRCA